MGAAFDAAVDHVEDFLLGVAMVVGVAFGVDDVGAEASEALLEALGDGDAGDGADVEVLEDVEGMVVAGEDVNEVEGLVGALDDFGGGVELPDGGDEFFGAEFVAFCDEDVVGAFEVGDGLAEGAAGEEVVVAEGAVAVDEADVEAAFEGEVLEAVVEEKCVAAEAGDGVPARFDAVFVHEDDDVFEVGGKHVGFVAGLGAVEEEGAAVGDDAGWDGVFLECDFGDDALPEGAGGAFVTTGEDGDAAAGFLEGAGEDFDDGGLAGAADGEVADADDLAAECVVAEDAVFPEVETELDGKLINLREAEEENTSDPRTEVAASFKDDVEYVLLDIFCPPPHGAVYCRSRRGGSSLAQRRDGLEGAEVFLGEPVFVVGFVLVGAVAKANADQPEPAEFDSFRNC